MSFVMDKRQCEWVQAERKRIQDILDHDPAKNGLGLAITGVVLATLVRLHNQAEKFEEVNGGKT